MSSETKSNTARKQVFDYLANEVWGPSMSLPEDAIRLPDPDSDGVVRFPKDQQDIKYFDPDTKQLLIQGIRPEMLYGTGVLHAPEAWRTSQIAAGADLVDDTDEGDIPISGFPEPDLQIKAQEIGTNDEGDDGFGLEQSQKIRPSAFGLTFRLDAKAPATDELAISFVGAVYQAVKVQFESYNQTNWFKRVDLMGQAKLRVTELRANNDQLMPVELIGDASKYVNLLARARTLTVSGQEIIAVTLVAKHSGAKSDKDADVDVFQAGLSVEIIGESNFLSNDSASGSSEPEMAEVNYLYRHVLDFATGHGISCEWDSPALGVGLKKLKTVALPTFYQEVLSFDTLEYKFRMDDLANASDSELKQQLSVITEGYAAWIGEHELAAGSLLTDDPAVIRLFGKARHILGRMRTGLETLFQPGNEMMLEAFKFANQAMYLQQRNGKRKRRAWSESTRESQALKFDPIVEGDTTKFGTWRPFQIGFLLMSVNGLLDPTHEDREEVDLIFFPTGGGKTEAYLGASALVILYRRLTQLEGRPGVDVLMRYTLRLLTIQQFERSSGLITALEHLRRQKPEKFGSHPISIGVWLGSTTTPNTRAESLKKFRATSGRDEPENPFVLSRCPWCGAGMGWDKSRKEWRGYMVLGIPKTVRFKCEARDCEFHSDQNPLPIWITDEDVFRERPSFILGTVDKFARMAWVPESRAIFNLDSDGVQVGAPPALIIQDELHLISGPLGSMVGLYESVLEELCTDRRNGNLVRPKIVASTATTRKYSEQINHLYGRSKVTLFPQAVSRANETYFSSVKFDAKGFPEKGTQYVGLNPSTYATGQMAASVVAATLLQASNQRPKEDSQMDFYWTSMWFFNSLRELGMTLTLMQSTVLDKIRGMGLYRRLPSGAKPRWPGYVLELTSRISSNKIKGALDDLGKKGVEQGAVSIGLSSSIMEVGVDVPRLGLLTIMSQPKSTAQYIQVSGRVGRDADGPGLVVMLYNAQRARDRSVYERFSIFHSRLYAQVEPVSVTPFSIPAMKHGLVGALLSMYRMHAKVNEPSMAPRMEVFERAVSVLRRRLEFGAPNPENVADFEAQIERFKKDWLRYAPGRWKYDFGEEGKEPKQADPALMRVSNRPLLNYPGDQSVMVPTSLRSVDGQTELKISHNPYAFRTENE